MVYLIPAEQCNCITCDGGKPAPPGYIGGSHCMCKCHIDSKYKAQRIKEQQRQIKNLVKEITNGKT